MVEQSSNRKTRLYEKHLNLIKISIERIYRLFKFIKIQVENHENQLF